VNSISSMSRYFRAFLYPTVLASLVLTAPSAMAQIASSTEVLKIAQAQANYNLLFVNPVTGSDSSDGSNQAPLKTIGRALETAAPNTIVVLAPGTYSTATGEQFPLFMKQDVTIQGESKDRGQQVVIQGSGVYLSRSFAKQKVTIVAANRSGLRGVTVTNSAPQGYGLWVESASPVISDNTFTGSTHDGVSVVGSSAPILRNNYFLQNGANGITIYGNSRPELFENIFENTGFGINIAQNAEPRLIGNRVTQNKDGIVVQGSAKPILRNNVIDGNKRDGLVAIAEARPDLGNTAEPGGNNFFGNGQNDINAKSSNQSIPAVGNQMATTTGALNFNAVPETNSPARVASLRPVAAKPAEPVATPVAVKPIAVKPFPKTMTIASQPVASQPVASQPTTPLPTPEVVATAPVDPSQLPLFNLADAPRRVKPRATTAAKPASEAELSISRPSATSGRNLPKVPALRVSKPMNETLTPSPLAPSPLAPSPLTTTSGQPIQLNVPPPESSGFATTPAIQPVVATAPVTARADVLPVPSAKIPMGNVGDSPSVPVWREGAGIARPNVASVKFRVLVNAIDSTQVAQVKAIVPGAFSTVIQGRSLLQAGAFSDRAKAEELLNTLQAQGIAASLVQQ
jgi:parallel beta-helix repeat protein